MMHFPQPPEVTWYMSLDNWAECDHPVSSGYLVITRLRGCREHSQGWSKVSWANKTGSRCLNNISITALWAGGLSCLSKCRHSESKLAQWITSDDVYPLSHGPKMQIASCGAWPLDDIDDQNYWDLCWDDTHPICPSQPHFTSSDEEKIIL